MPPKPLLSLLLAAALVPTLHTASVIWSNYPHSILAPNRATIYQDFIVMWVSGKLALAGRLSELATPEAFESAIHAFLQPGIDIAYWHYPPHMLLLSAPLATLPPMAAMAAWVAATAGLLWLALGGAGIGRTLRSLVLLSPAVWENAVDGQNGALLTAGMAGAIGWSTRRPVLAGMCLSILTLKPHVALVVPVLLLALRAWRALAWGVAFAALWIGAAVLCFGTAPWFDYVQRIVPQAGALHLAMDVVPFGTLHFQNLVVTPFAAMRVLGLDPAAAKWVQAAATVACLLLAWAAGRAAIAPSWRLAIALALIPLATPYALTYDMIGPSLAVLLLLRDAPPSRPVVYAAGLAWVWPGLALYVGDPLAHPGLGAAVFALLLAVLWWSALHAGGGTWPGWTQRRAWQAGVRPV